MSNPQNKTGTTHIAEAFARARAEGRAALMPYLTLGYPTPHLSLELVEAIVAGGADLVELGIPFSDPLADGPTIQRATYLALQQGMTVARCLEMAAELRARGVQVPLLFMGYLNPILAYGVEAFVRASAQVGVDGLIVPNLPPEEADEVEEACRNSGLALVYLLAPTSTDERIALVSRQATGFIYLVSVTGVTGARNRLPPGLAGFVSRVRAVTEMPLAVGFGISTPVQARQVGELADGVVVGSAIVRLAEDESARKVEDFVRSLRRGLEGR
ncbi:MAG: tryptophan synthase subunit alpha [Chloroflexi bacterium]|nr:tryptophan synthase subunit alpha [Chloroflexota bacterium]